MKPQMSDEELGFALQAMLAEADPVPHEALVAASAALAWRDMDTALAALTNDSLADAPFAVVRGTPPRLLSFAADSVTIDLEVTAEAGTVRLLGQIAPAQAADIVVEYTDGSRAGRTDDLGRFTIDGLPELWLRVVVTTSGADSLRSHTEWFRA